VFFFKVFVDCYLLNKKQNSNLWVNEKNFYEKLVFLGVKTPSLCCFQRLGQISEKKEAKEKLSRRGKELIVLPVETCFLGSKTCRLFVPFFFLRS
jgi:hypothetical protein